MADRSRLAPIRGQFGIPEGTPLLLSVGRLAEEKNVDLTLRAFVEVRRRDQGVMLLVAGGGPALETMRQTARDLGIGDAVRFAGYLARGDVFRCAAEADVFLFPSVTDTQGIVIVEAMALGVPCVATDSAAVRGLVIAGRNGLLTQNDPGAFAGAVLQLLADPDLRARMGHAARETAAGYAAAPLAGRLLGLYEKVTGAAAAKQ
jgi:glycosyltransferase involved in cell wall biosynthesis